MVVIEHILIDIYESSLLNINGVEDWTYVDFSGSLKQYHSGKAILEIESLDTQYGSSLYIPYTGQNIYEIPPTSFNGEMKSGPLCIKYETGNPRSIDLTVWIIALALLFVVTAEGFILTYYPKNSLVYVGTVVLIFLIICLKYPTYTIGGEAWAEVGQLYVPAAQNNGFIKNLFVLESGLYLNLFGRLITWASVHSFSSISGAVFAINIVSVLLVSMMGSALATGALRKYITPLESIVISVLVTTCLVNAETVATPLIVGYWGIIPALTLLAVIIFQLDITNRMYWFLGSMAIMSTLSRMSFFVLIPILLILMLLRYREMTCRDLFFICIELIACLFQGVISLMIRKTSGLALAGENGLGSISISNPLRLLERIVYSQVQVVNTMFRVQIGNFLLWNLLVFAVIIGGSLFLLVCVIKSRHRQQAVFILSLLLLSIGNAAILLIAGSEVSLEGWSSIMSLTKNRQWFFSYVALVWIVLSVFIWLRQSEVWKRERVIRVSSTALITLCMLELCSFQAADSGHFFIDDYIEIGNMENYSIMATNKEYLIPVAPAMETINDWYYKSSGCQIQRATVEKGYSLNLNLDAQYAVSLYVHKDTWENQISHERYFIKIYDKDGALVADLPQISDPEEAYVGFDLDMNINGISRVEFYHKDGTQAFVSGGYVIGYLGAAT